MLKHTKNLLEGSLIKYVAVVFHAIVTVAMLIPSSGISLLNLPQSDKLLHMVIYLILFVLWAFAFRKKVNKNWMFGLLVAVLTIYGIVIEIIQEKWIVSRTSDFWDVMANSMGIILGIVVYYKLKHRFHLKN